MSLPRSNLHQIVGNQRISAKPIEYADIQVNKSLSIYPTTMEDATSNHSDSTVKIKKEKWYERRCVRREFREGSCCKRFNLLMI